MPTDVRTISVFVASPSDVGEEREAVRRAATAINNAIGAQFALRLDVVGWEMVQPGYGRPQERINPLLDNCDIFVGIMYRRWGNYTGTHTSGFEEEYERVLVRRQNAEVPVIGMYFKKIGEEFLTDPGPDLTKVLTFKKKMQAEKKILYREFGDALELEKDLQTFFLTHLAHASETLRLQSPDGAPTGSIEAPVHPEEELDEARLQLGQTLSGFADLVTKGKAERALDRDRLLLFALSINQDGDAIPTHTVNRLYNESRNLVLAAAEYDAWLRTLLADVARSTGSGWGRVVPGWRILFPSDHSNSEWISEQIVKVAQGADAQVVNGSWIVLDGLSARPVQLWGGRNESLADSSMGATGVVAAETTPVQIWLDFIGEGEVPSSVQRYLFNVATSGDKSLLKALAAASKDPRAISFLNSLQRWLEGDAHALVDLAETEYRIPRWLESPLVEHMAELSIEELTRLSSKSTYDGYDVQLRAIKELLRREKLTSSVVKKALSSSNEKMQRETLEALRGADGSILPQLLKDVNEEKLPEDIRPAYLALLSSTEDLRSLVSSPITGLKAWEALAWKLKGAMDSEARLVMDTDAQCLEGAFAGLEEGVHDEVREYLRGRARRAAIIVLTSLDAEKIETEDVDRIRKEVRLGYWHTRDVAISALAKVGEVDDLDALVAAALDVHNYELSRTIAQSAIAIGGPSVARRLLFEAGDESLNIEVVKSAAEALCSMPQAQDAELVALLNHPQGAVRVLAVRGLVRRWDDHRLRELLEQYAHPTAGPYFYDVVVALDQYLFAPAPLKSSL